MARGMGEFASGACVEGACVLMQVWVTTALRVQPSPHGM
jgi:hypothetical protein